MFHIAHKLYLCHESTIDVNNDRVVISEENGVPMYDVIQRFSYGTLIKSAKSVEEVMENKTPFVFFTELIDRCVQYDKPIYIYTNDFNIALIQSMWFKLIFKEPTEQAARMLYNSNMFKYDMFNRSRFSSNHNASTNLTLNETMFIKAYREAPSSTTTQKRSFYNRYSKYYGIEYLLATYVYNGSTKEQLKNTIKNLFRKDLEKYIYELKEIFIVHFMTRTFKDSLRLEKPYTLSNIADIKNDRSRFAELFMSDRLFTSPGMDVPSSKANKNFLFENLTSDDVAAFKEFTILAGTTWGEESIYQYIKSDINKLDFVDIIIGEFTDERLADLIDAEASYEHAAGSFFSIDLETVNNYVIEYILDSRFKNDKEPLRNIIVW